MRRATCINYTMADGRSEWDYYEKDPEETPASCFILGNE